MLFNSYIFVILFLPIVLALWWNRSVPTSVRLGGLTLMSYAFYGWWDWRFVGLLMVSTVIDYAIGSRLHFANDTSKRNLWLVASLCSNLGLLAYFKYCGFFASSLNAVADWLRVGGTIPVPSIVLPVGISFYTFQTMSYTIDIYRGKAKPTESLLHFAAYVSLFPQLIAGPIVRYSEMDEQLRNLIPKISWDRFWQGIVFFVAGMCQKVLFADTIANKINPLFQNYEELQFFGAWFAMLGYTCQLYFDFCGYSNMAVGLGRMLGFEFPQNFDSPYKSPNISVFWRTWHITLSFWLRDYLFIPLGGSRHGRWLTLRNLVIVMFLGGLWHGAGWTFVLWGLYHGGLLAGHAIFKSTVDWSFPKPLAIAVTFVAIVFGWTIFRSTDLTMCGSLMASMLMVNGIEPALLSAVGGTGAIAVLAVLLGIVFFSPNIWQFSIRPSLTASVVAALLFVFCVLRFDAESPFLYFQF